MSIKGFAVALLWATIILAAVLMVTSRKSHGQASVQSAKPTVSMTTAVPDGDGNKLTIAFQYALLVKANVDKIQVQLDSAKQELGAAQQSFNKAQDELIAKEKLPVGSTFNIYPDGKVIANLPEKPAGGERINTVPGVKN